MLRIGMLTSGGDCQALNAAMRGVVKTLLNNRKIAENRRIANEIEKIERAKKSSGNNKGTQGKRYQK